MNSLTKLSFITVLSFVLIFYKFNQIPKNLSYDEVEFAKLAISLDGKPYSPYSQLATGHSTLYFYLILLSFKIFGVNNFALRFPSALFGVLNIIIFYLIMEKVFNKQFKFPNYLITQLLNYPFILSLIFLTLRWYFNFARFAFEATFLLFLELASIYFLLHYINIMKWPFLVTSGVFAGLAFNSYTPGRIFFLLPLAFLFIKKVAIKSLILFLVPLIIVIAPLQLYLLQHPDVRVNQQFFLKNNELSMTKKAEFLWQNIKSTALMFNFKGDVNGRHNYPGKPALNPILGGLFIIGLLISLKNYKNPVNLFSIFYFLLSIFPALVTYPWENPNMLRTFTVLPSVIYLIGIAMYNLSAAALKLYPKKKFFIFYFLFFILILSSLYEWRTYFKYQSQVFNQAFEVKGKLPAVLNLKIP